MKEFLNPAMDLEQDLRRWIRYKNTVLERGNLGEVVEDPYFLSLAQSERDLPEEQDARTLLAIVMDVYEMMKGLIAKGQRESPRGNPLSEYTENFEEYQKTKADFVKKKCSGRAVLFDIAWNVVLLRSGEEFNRKLLSFYVNNFGLNDKNIDHSPLIVEKEKTEKSMFANRIVIHLPEDRLLLLPHHAEIIVFCRHGKSFHDSRKKKVGSLCVKGQFITEEGRKVAGNLALRISGALGLLLKTAKEHGREQGFSDFHFSVSSSPNTRQVADIIMDGLRKNGEMDRFQWKEPVVDPANNSQNFGLETNLPKVMEQEELFKATGLSEERLTGFIVHPLRVFLGSNEHKIDYFLRDILSFRSGMEGTPGGSGIKFAVTHSSRLNNILIFLNPLPFHEAYRCLNKIRESTDASIMIAYNPLTKTYSKYDSWVGETTSRERVEYSVSVTREEVRTIGVLGGGGTAPSMNNALRMIANKAREFEKELVCFQGGFKGLTQNQVFPGERLQQLLGDAGMRIGAGRFQEFLREDYQRAALGTLRVRKIDFLICIGGNGTMKGALALAEKEVSVLGIPATIDGDFRGYTLGLNSAATYNADLINKKFKPDSASMIDYVYDIVTMGRNAGHLPLLTAQQTGAEGCFLYEIGSEEADIVRTAKKIISNLEKGNSHVIVRSEHPALQRIPERLEQAIKKILGRKVKVATEVVGRAQRSAPVVVSDALLSQKMGKVAMESIFATPEKTRAKVLVSLDGKEVVPEELPYAVNNPNPLNVAGYYEWLRDYGSLHKQDLENLDLAQERVG